jgi:hypothetical protein
MNGIGSVTDLKMTPSGAVLNLVEKGAIFR